MTALRRRLAVAAAALAFAGLSIVMLERPRFGLKITPTTIGATPVTSYHLPDAEGPQVIVAHGFAGSRQLMQGYSLTLARAGLVVVAFDFQGHGRKPVPMSGDVTAIDGTTRLARRTGPAAVGLALGLILAWALGVSFPLFDAGRAT